jgi:HK97 family phage prohead protease
MNSKQFITSVSKSGAANSRQLTFTASTQSVDRSGDRILGPWKLDAFRKNGIILWAHDYRSLPIAKAKSISVIDGALVCVAEFIGPELSPMADQVYRLYEAGFLKAVSVGFRPIDAPVMNDTNGYDFKSCDLLEISCVPVPANGEALMRGLKSTGNGGRQLSDAEIVRMMAETMVRADEEAAVRRIVESQLKSY